MTLSDVLSAQLITEVGVAQEMGYHPDERRRIALHEAGHALTAVLIRRDVKVASILRRSAALGLVAHGDAEERHLAHAHRGPRPDLCRDGRTRRRDHSSTAKRAAESARISQRQAPSPRSWSASSATARGSSASKRRRCRRPPTSWPRCSPTRTAAPPLRRTWSKVPQRADADGHRPSRRPPRDRRSPVRTGRGRRVSRSAPSSHATPTSPNAVDRCASRPNRSPDRRPRAAC